MLLLSFRLVIFDSVTVITVKINLDRTSSGFCIGVQGTIHVAEEKLAAKEKLFSLGDVVHNEVEVKRLEALGLTTIDDAAFRALRDSSVLVRAHGEPPETYSTAKRNNLDITDTTCPVVSKLQRTARLLDRLGYQVVIYGKRAHPEVVGINGHCGNRGVIIKHADLSDPEELKTLDTGKKTALISQTTMDVPGFYELKANLEARFASDAGVPAQPWTEVRDIDITAAMTGQHALAQTVFKDTICRQVSSRNRKLHEFALANSCVIFVAGRKSSNGQVLYGICRNANPRSYFIEDVEDLRNSWFEGIEGGAVESVGICGATSTPMWLLEKVAGFIDRRFNH